MLPLVRVIQFECSPSVEWKSFSRAGYLIELPWKLQSLVDSCDFAWSRGHLYKESCAPNYRKSLLVCPCRRQLTCLHATMEVLALADFVREEPFRPGFGGRQLVFTNSSGISNRPPHKSFARTSHNLPQGVVNNSQPGVVGLLANGHVQRKQHFSVVCLTFKNNMPIKHI